MMLLNGEAYTGRRWVSQSKRLRPHREGHRATSTGGRDTTNNPRRVALSLTRQSSKHMGRGGGGDMQQAGKGAYVWSSVDVQGRDRAPSQVYRGKAFLKGEERECLGRDQPCPARPSWPTRTLWMGEYHRCGVQGVRAQRKERGQSVMESAEEDGAQKCRSLHLVMGAQL